MKGLQVLRSALVGGASVLTLTHPAAAKLYSIPEGDLSAALFAYMTQSNVELYYADDVVRGHTSHGAKGNYSETAALTQILKGTGFTTLVTSTNAIQIVPQREPEEVRVAQARRAPVVAAPAQQGVETVVVTAQHKSENIQQVPISITALSQAQLTERQIAGGPDLLRDVPNMNFTKTNFSGYDIELRGIGTQAISVTTDPAVAVAFNDTPFIRNHFFEQEFYDLDDAEVLLGPQGTLYGRNATAGVVNLKSALPDDTYEAMLSADLGNYNNRRLEGMLNLPIIGDTLDIRFAGEWTKREGYTEDTTLDTHIDGRDLWSTRMTIGWKPASNFQTYLIWEHFNEDDDRLRSGKQLCETSQPATSVDGVPVPPVGTRPPDSFVGGGGALTLDQNYTSQGCQATSLYLSTAFQVPFGPSLPAIIALDLSTANTGDADPYAFTTQSTNLRQIQSTLLPSYKAKNDTLEFNGVYNINPSLTLTSQTGFNRDYLYSTEDYNRFDTTPGVFLSPGVVNFPAFPGGPGTEIFCDPQLGCSDRLVSEDLSEEHAWQLSQEFRLASNFSGPFNFNVGGNFLHYETEENYYVFINALSIYSYVDGDHGGTGSVPDNSDCLQKSPYVGGWQNLNPILGGGEPAQSCVYIDPNPLSGVNNKGHNYFLSQNPYTLNSYAGFGEAYYNITNALKLTAGLRYTIDDKHFTDIPSEVINQGYGYPVTGIVNQQWDRLTGRTVLDWSPDLSFTDQTLLYASYSHGYKAGGANPPGAEFSAFGDAVAPSIVHPLTFKPEYIEAFELGTKNTLLDSSLTLNGDIFYYNYTGYQISEIVDRTAINNNYNAHVEGAELSANWEPVPGLKFNFAGGWEDTAAAGGDTGIDLMNRTASMPGWMVIKPFPTEASNCILPDYVVAALLQEQATGTVPNSLGGVGPMACEIAYTNHLDPVTNRPYILNPTGISADPYVATGELNSPAPIPVGYPGFNPATAAINNGEGFSENLAHHALPNAPPFTVSLGGEYSMPVTEDWVATLRGDFYYQADSWARIFNDNPYDRLLGYTNVNVAVVLTSANGWQVMGYVKNVFNVTAITGDFLNSDDSGLTTNVFLTDPRLYGIRVTKHLDEADGFWGEEWSGADFFTDLFSDKDNGKPQVWIELGTQLENVSGQGEPFAPAFLASNPTSTVLWNGTSPLRAQTPSSDFDEEAKITFQPTDSDWVLSATVRYGRVSAFKEIDHQTNRAFVVTYFNGVPNPTANIRGIDKFSDTQVNRSESHSVMDFMAGKDVGLGMFGLDGSSVLSGGVRIAQLASEESFSIRARPDVHFKYAAASNIEAQLPYFQTDYATGQASRKFRGVGPAISWNGSTPVTGAPDGGITFDWGANAALLFGRQKTRVQHHESQHYVTPHFVFNAQYYLAYSHPAVPRVRDRFVTVPNLGGFAGISYRYQNAKISFGYRTDFFFGAIDGGIDKPKSENLGFSGPFATISFGLGG